MDRACGKDDPLKVTRGKLHEHLGMSLDFRTKGRVIFTQCDSMKKFWSSLLEDLREAHGSTLAPENLFKIDGASTKLDTKRRDECYATTAKVLHFGQRARACLQVSSRHHGTRVKDPSEQDWSKF